ncbi:ydl025c-like protein [Moniliophthora roreri MCA 2997]|uniref:Ydl025c-like protein n=2 Tax=Moniliophthora roreri TaxID=221103 RepID=V2WCI3_MONRO|nr:ydl025c-like protein [Moniliophthora roreri MCA 2997]KAI3615450.1 ydl025c-like protein [Moniliophthora roreri]
MASSAHQQQEFWNSIAENVSLATPSISATPAAPAASRTNSTPGNGFVRPPPPIRMHVKRVTLTSKKNWWMVEMNDEEEEKKALSTNSYASDETVVEPLYSYHHPEYRQSRQGLPDTKKEKITPPPSPPIYNPPRHPTAIFSFPTPTSYSAPPNPTANLAPCAQGSASELFKCVVKKPDIVQIEINGEMQSNASDVTVQFLAELRVYTTVTRHRNICAFLGSLENVGMVLEYIDGRTLYDVISVRPELTRAKKIDYHNQLLDGLTHLHSFGLSHGDLSLLNVQVTIGADTIKLLDFGRSVSIHSTYTSPDDDPVDPFPGLADRKSLQCPLPSTKTEQIHPGTRPFCAPEILRGECQDALLADAYSFGMILVCLDRCEGVDVKPWDQRKDLLPKDLFENCTVFEERARDYLKKWNAPRRGLVKGDMLSAA